MTVNIAYKSIITYVISQLAYFLNFDVVMWS